MKDLLNQIETLTTSFMKDASSQLDKGNKAAGLRARRASLELEPLLKRFRNKEIFLCIIHLFYNNTFKFRAKNVTCYITTH